MKHTHKKLIATTLATATSISISFTPTAKASVTDPVINLGSDEGASANIFPEPNEPTAGTHGSDDEDSMGDSADVLTQREQREPSPLALDGRNSHPSNPTTDQPQVNLPIETIRKGVNSRFNEMISKFPGSKKESGLEKELEKKGIAYKFMSYQEFSEKHLEQASKILTEPKPALTCTFFQNNFLIVFDPDKCAKMDDNELNFLAAYALANLFDTVINFHFVPELQAYINSLLTPSMFRPVPSTMLEKMYKQDTGYHRWLTHDCYPSNGNPIQTKIEEIRTDSYTPSTVFPEIDAQAKAMPIVSNVRIASPYLDSMSAAYKENRHRFAATFALNYLETPGKYSHALRTLMEFYSTSFLL